DNSTVFLIGVPETSLQVSVVDISDITFPIVKSTHLSDPTSQWIPNTSKACFAYLGKSNSLPGSPIHIQQFGPSATWSTIFFSEIKVFDQVRGFSPYDLLSRQNFAFVGQSGIHAWAMALGTTTINNTYPWNNLQWDGRFNSSPNAVIT
ncbi:hypothetical protein BGX24_006919, partial [Mortierella sp. AD032]